ncbi:MAG TPA: 50S ribosomal protein L5 [Dehalococcoidia bacterium]|nr:50S ribosomal protein L5 [Dehalococcoidia bacterium]
MGEKTTTQGRSNLPRLKGKYHQEVVPTLMVDFGYNNLMQVPRLEKVVLSIGLGEAIQNPKALEMAGRDLADISGQHPVITRAKRSIANFKLRAGMPIGMMVTLRGRRMYDFLDKLFNAVLPRFRDFQGVSRNSFDGRGSYSLGLKDQLIFPEIDYDKVDKGRGLEITIVTTASSDEEGRRLLELLGMPFARG